MNIKECIKSLNEGAIPSKRTEPDLELRDMKKVALTNLDNANKYKNGDICLAWNLYYGGKLMFRVRFRNETIHMRAMTKVYTQDTSKTVLKDPSSINDFYEKNKVEIDKLIKQGVKDFTKDLPSI